jgi:uncharacterized membrane protein
MNVSLPVLLLSCGVMIAIVLVLFWHPQRSRAKTSTSTDRPHTGTIFRDDDRYWYGGVFYGNPDDPDLFVPKRFGLGWTLNFGHPQARLILISLLLFPPVLLILTVLIFGTAPIGCHTFGCHPLP